MCYQELKSTVSMTNLLGERLLDVDVNPDSMQVFALTSKKKDLYAVSLVSKLDPSYNEKKIVKKYSLPKSALNHHKLAFVLSKSLLLLYSDEPHVTVFDCKKESFQKTLLTKVDVSRRSPITSLAVSPCGNFILLADLLGDLQLWSIQAKSIDLVHCSNLSTRGILCVDFIKNEYNNQLSHGICYSLDQQIYLVDFEQISRTNYSLVLANKLTLPGTTDISMKEYKTLGIKPFLSASRTKKAFRVHALKVSRMSDGSLIPGTQTVEYALEETLPVDTQVLFGRFRVSGVITGFDATNFSFTCEGGAEVFFLTLQGVFVYSVPTGATRQILGFDSLFSKKDRLPAALGATDDEARKGVFELNKLEVVRVNNPQKHFMLFAAVTLDKMSLSASLVCLLLDAKSWRIRGEPVVLSGVVDFGFGIATEPQSGSLSSAVAAEPSAEEPPRNEVLTTKKLWLIEEFHRTLSSYSINIVRNARSQSLAVEYMRLSQRELHESVQRVIGSAKHDNGIETIRLYSKIREAVFLVHAEKVSNPGTDQSPGDIVSLANESLAEIKLHQGEIIKDCFSWSEFAHAQSEGHSSPESDITWDWGLLTSSRICLISSNHEIVTQVSLSTDYNSKGVLLKDGSKQFILHQSKLKICGIFERCLILQNEDSIFSQKIPSRTKHDSLDSPIVVSHIDSTNSVLVSLLPDRLITAKTHLQENEKTIALEFQQRQGSSLGLILESYLEEHEDLPSPEYLESLVSIMWESQLSTQTISSILERASNRVHLELACRFGGADDMYEKAGQELQSQDSTVKEYLLGRMKDLLVTAFTANKETPPAEVIRRYRGEMFADHAIQELFNKVGILLKLKLLLADGSQESDTDEESQILKILPKLGDLVAQYELSKKNQRLKKKDVPFGQEIYRVYDGPSGAEFNFPNTKDLLGYLGFSKTRVPATNLIPGKDDRTTSTGVSHPPEPDADSDTEAEGGFKNADDECAGLLFLWRMDEDICPQIKDTTERRINGVVKGQSYKWEQFRGDCPLEFEDKWGKVGWLLTNRVYLNSPI